ncbi:MAG: porin family protein [Rhodothermales bacterium]|nr:porin family protein [Rhodothermales bacterium]MBO6781326.1 porin family protein [Rhodothermales bacterium]
MRLIPLLALLMVLPAAAQDTRVYVGSGVGFTAGPGDVVDWWQRGPTFDVALGRRFADRFEVTAGLGYVSLPLSRDKLLAVGADIDISGGEYTVTSFQAGLRLEFERGTFFRPYLHVGVGLHSVSIKELLLTVNNPEDVCPGQPTCVFTFAPATREDETVPGLRLGAGVAWYLSDTVWLYAEPSYHIILAEERTGLVPFRLGVASAF